MAKYKLIEINEAIKLSGWVLLPIDSKTKGWELTHILDIDDNYEDSEAEIYDEYIVDIPDEEMKYQTCQPIYYEDVEKYIVNDDDNGN